MYWADFGPFKVRAFMFVGQISARSKSGRSGLLDGFLLVESEVVQVCQTGFCSFKVRAFRFVRQIFQ